MKISIRLALFCALVLAVVGGIYKSATTPASTEAVSAQEGGAPTNLAHVKVLTGSAKFGFLKDEKLTALLAKEGIALDLEKTGATDTDIARAAQFDVIWPAGANAASDFTSALKGTATYPVFSSPLAIASWKKLVPVLTANGIVKAEGSHADFLLEKALPLMVGGKRWNQLSNNDVFAVNKGFLVNTPDVRKSSTGALFVATLAYVRNGNDVPEITKASVLAADLSPLITRQGFQEGTLSGPFEDYIGQGMGKAPLVLVYESQFFEAKRQGKLTDSHILMYPQPGLVLKHIMVARTNAGKKLGEFMASNRDVQKIAAEYGFRTNDPSIFAASAKEIGLDAPELLNLADAPATLVLDAMNQVLISKLEGK
jgi:hypothetical protein